MCDSGKTFSTRFRHLPFAAIGVAAYVLGLAAPFEWDVPLIVLAVCGVLSATMAGRQRGGAFKSPLLGLLVLYLCATALSILVSVDLDRSLRLSASLLPAALLFYLIAEQVNGVRQVTLIYASFSLAGLWTASALVWASLSEPGGQPSTWVSKVASTILVVPNDVTFLAVIAPLSLALLYRRPRTPLALLAALSILLSLAAIALVQSRTALLTLLVSTAVATGLLRPRLGAVWVVGVLAIVTIFDGLLGFPLLAKFSQFTGTRLPLWVAAWEMFRDAPFLGQGPHTYVLAYESHLAGSNLPDWLKIDPRRTPWPHNLYLEVLAEQGLIGLGALGALLAVGARLGWSLSISARRERRLYGTAALSALIGFCFAALLESSFLRLWVMITLFVLLGLLVRLARSDEGVRSSDEKEF